MLASTEATSAEVSPAQVQAKLCHLSSGGPLCLARADGSVQCNTFWGQGEACSEFGDRRSPCCPSVAWGNILPCSTEVPLSFLLCKVSLLLLLLFALPATFCTNERTAVCFLVALCRPLRRVRNRFYSCDGIVFGVRLRKFTFRGVPDLSARKTVHRWLKWMANYSLLHCVHDLVFSTCTVHLVEHSFGWAQVL